MGCSEASRPKTYRLHGLENPGICTAEDEAIYIINIHTEILLITHTRTDSDFFFPLFPLSLPTCPPPLVRIHTLFLFYLKTSCGWDAHRALSTCEVGRWQALLFQNDAPSRDFWSQPNAEEGDLQWCGERPRERLAKGDRWHGSARERTPQKPASNRKEKLRTTSPKTAYAKAFPGQAGAYSC